MSNSLFDHSKSGLIFTFLICVPHLLLAQANLEDIVIGKVGDQEITYTELEKNFTSGDGNEPTLTELEEFLPVYLDYRAKLLAAKEEGYFEDPELIAELNESAHEISYQVAKQLTTKYSPRVTFEYDMSFAKAARIEEKLDEIRDESEEKE